MQLDLDLTASFLVLAEEKHFGRAAARLHLSSPALTKRIQRLERQVGVVLVDRGPAGVLCVTDAGRRFAAAAGPLLAQAEAARAAALRRTGRDVVRIGVPAGTRELLSASGLGDAVRRTAHRWPDARFVCHEVPFGDLADCVTSGRVDLLWDASPDPDPRVESVRLAAGSPIIGVVSDTHPLAEAGEVEVEVFCEEPMLFNPALPAAWMEPYWLAGVRPRREARLVACEASDQLQVLRTAAAGSAVVAVPAVVRPALGRRLRALDLRGAPAVAFHLARRRADRRDAVLALVEAFRAVPDDAFTGRTAGTGS